MRTKEPSIRLAAALLLCALFLSAPAWGYPPYTGPTLGHPPGTDLFRDGSAVVTLAHVTDGDTAAFVVGGVVYPTRFLAVNTPETSHPTEGTEPWGYAAKDFTRKLLENADQIVLELDPKSDLFDRYDRLLAWVWVDGELLNYRLVEEGLAWGMYLYGDYRYNDILIAKESEVRKTRIRIHGEKDPSFDYGKAVQALSIAEARTRPPGTHVRTEGVVTATIGNNAFIQEGECGIYCYAGTKRWRAFAVGNRIAITGMTTEYNGLLEIGNIEEVVLLAAGTPVPRPIPCSLARIGEPLEGLLVTVSGFTIEEVITAGGRGYDVRISQGGVRGFIRIDKYLVPYIEPGFFVPGRRAEITAPVGQYKGTYQLMLARAEDFRYLE